MIVAAVVRWEECLFLDVATAGSRKVVVSCALRGRRKKCSANYCFCGAMRERGDGVPGNKDRAALIPPLKGS